MKKQRSKNWGGHRNGAGRKPSLAKALVKNFGRYRVTQEDIKKYGGRWDEGNSCYVFPDGSAGRFTDISQGASEMTASGESVLHFVVID